MHQKKIVLIISPISLFTHIMSMLLIDSYFMEEACQGTAVTKIRGFIIKLEDNKLNPFTNFVVNIIFQNRNVKRILNDCRRSSTSIIIIIVIHYYFFKSSCERITHKYIILIIVVLFSFKNVYVG